MSKFSVKKPFTVLVGVIVALILGVVSLMKMQLDLLPEISLPYLIVVTTYPGASAQKVETEICEPMESTLGVISGVENVYSICSENYGMVELEFRDDIDIDSAMVKVSAALNSLESTLPDECGTPTIMEISADMLASMYLAVGMDGMEIEELSQFVEDDIVPAFERIDGVASVSKLGLVEKTIQVELDQEKVDALNDKILALADDKFAEAVEKLENAKKQLEDSQDTINDSKKQLVDSQNELNDGKQELADGKAELEKNKKTLEDTKKDTFNKLATGSEALEAVETYRAELTVQQAALDTINAQIDNLSIDYQKLIKINSSFSQSDIAEVSKIYSYRNSISDSQLDDTISAIDLTNYHTVANNLDGKLNVEKIKALDASSKYSDAKTAFDETIISFNEAISDSGTQSITLDEAAMTEIVTGITLLATKSSLEMDVELNKAALDMAEEALKENGISYTDIEVGKMEASSKFGSAEAQIAAAEAQLDAAESQLDSGQKQITEGWKSLRDGEKQLKDGWEQYNDSVKQYEKQKAEALKKANADDLLTLQTLASLIYAQNFAMPAGYVDDEFDNSWLVEVGDNFSSIDELEQSVLCNIKDIGDVKLCDVANITVIDNSKDSYVRLDGNQAVILSVFKSSTSGTNEVSKLCKERIKELKEEYPGLNISIQMDQGDYINLIVKSVLQSMVLGSILAIVILAIFLKDAKPTIVVAISIPLSVLIALICMYFAKISLNMLSLSGLALGIGMLVDNSVVVIENIYRLRVRGIEAPRAAVQGTKQVAGAIIASTITSICVFFPMVYTTGIVSELMMPMCMAIIFTLLASLLIAMTVVPAAGSTILKNAKPKEHPFFDRVLDIYEKLLSFCLKFKAVPLLLAVALLAISIAAIVKMGIVMIPEMSANQIEATLTIENEGLNRDECYKIVDQAMDLALSVEGVGSVAILDGNGNQLITGMGSGSENFRSYSFMILTENPDAGSDEIKQMTDDMCAKVGDIDGVSFEVKSAMGEMSQLFGSGLSINIYGTDIQEMLDASELVMEKVNAIEGFEDVTNGQEDADKVIHLAINKNTAMSLGLSVAQIYQDIATKLTTSADSVKVTIDDIDMQITIVNELEPLNKENLMDREFTIEVVDEDGDTITEEHKLSEFAEEVIRDGVSSINRKNQSRYITVSASVAEGYNTTLLSRELKPELEKLELPGNCTLEMGGEYDTVMEMVKQMGLVVLLGAAFIYLVMVAQFQSLLSPFIVLFTIPLAFTGGLFSLILTGENLSALSMMGFVVLMGTVVNNGIVFVDYVNQLRKAGMDRKNALIATGKTRMRPILMTALTTILAESYLITGKDMGSQMGKGMALVIAGGLAYATLMTLFIIPVIYDIMFKKQPLDVDTGSENLDDVPDDAADYMASLGLQTVETEEDKTKKHKKRKLKKYKSETKDDIQKVDDEYEELVEGTDLEDDIQDLDKDDDLE